MRPLSHSFVENGDAVDDWDEVSCTRCSLAVPARWNCRCGSPCGGPQRAAANLNTSKHHTLTTNHTSLPLEKTGF